MLSGQTAVNWKLGLAGGGRFARSPVQRHSGVVVLSAGSWSCFLKPGVFEGGVSFISVLNA